MLYFFPHYSIYNVHTKRNQLQEHFMTLDANKNNVFPPDENN
jgi:hypothetical protein